MLLYLLGFSGRCLDLYRWCRPYFGKTITKQASNAILKTFIFESKYERVTNAVGKVEAYREVIQC